MFYSRTIKI